MGSHYSGGSAGTHHGSNGAHHPAASYGSHYSGGSAGTHHGSNHAPCDATYCPEKCAKYYHCQFEHSQTPDCADAPDDCAARCAGCPPPTAEHGSNYGSNHGDWGGPMATHGSKPHPNDDTTKHDGGSAGTHHGSNGAHHPAASYGSHYSGGSAGTHHGSNHAPCDATYCPEKCAKYYHCQFEHSQTPDCADAPDDCAARCAGCPPPTAEHGNNYGSHYGSDYDTVGVVGSHGGQYSDTPMHDKLPGEHSAPTCLHNCFVHYAWKENLPRGEEPRCNLWSDYLFGDGCQEAHLKPTCYSEHDMHEVLLKCIDTGCDPR